MTARSCVAILAAMVDPSGASTFSPAATGRLGLAAARPTRWLGVALSRLPAATHCAGCRDHVPRAIAHSVVASRRATPTRITEFSGRQLSTGAACRCANRRLTAKTMASRSRRFRLRFCTRLGVSHAVALPTSLVVLGVSRVPGVAEFRAAAHAARLALEIDGRRSDDLVSRGADHADGPTGHLVSRGRDPSSKR
jgi:hypothetical protein